MADTPARRDNAVLFHHPDAVDTTRTKLMGRHAAGEGFLNGFVAHSGVEAFYSQVLDPEHLEDFKRRVKRVDALNRSCEAIPFGKIPDDERARTVWMPGPDLGPFAWRRRTVGNRAYSLCGVNHTIASETVMDSLSRLLTTPVQPWDALICTSNAVKATVTQLLDNWGDFLNGRSGGRFQAQLQLPVIPLGVDCAPYAASEENEATRASVRRGLGVRDDDVVVLFFGRLSFHAKAHPLPMYLALEEAAKRTGKRVHLIQAGWFASDAIEKEFRQGVRDYCPSVNGIFLDGREPDVRTRVWFAADIFTSLSDNIQETFGLTPIEAMAAGLPVVISDWDGYRDTVRDGVDGFAIPTWLPIPESGSDLALAPETALDPSHRDTAYNHYCGNVSQMTAVDVAAATEAFTALIRNPDLRRNMGEAGRARARDVYDWRVVVGQYQDLWRELANIRNRAAEVGPPSTGRPVNPLRDDPFSLFAAYPTHTVDGDVMVALSRGIGPIQGNGTERLAAVTGKTMNAFATPMMLDEADRGRILAHLGDNGPATVISLAELVPEDVRYRLPRTLAWLAKMGIVQLTASVAVDAPATEAPAPAPAGSDVSDVQRWLDLGLAARGRGALEAAADYFSKALREDPRHAIANNQMGEIMATAMKMDQAVLCFRRALEGIPDYLPAQRNLGKVLFLKGDQPSGVAALEKAVEMAPDDAESHFLLGVCCRRAGAANQAVPRLEKAIQIDPQRTDARYQLGLAQKALGRRDDAAATFEQVLESESGHVFADAALMSLRAEGPGRSALGKSKQAKRVAFYIAAAHHVTQLRPLFEAALDGASGTAHWPVMTADGRELVEFDPHVVVICEGEAKPLRPMLANAGFVRVHDGLATRSELDARGDPGDHVCVMGPAAAEEWTQKAEIDPASIWQTGVVSMDPIFRGDPASLAFELPADGRIVLYAPAFDRHLTSADMLGERVVQLIRGMRTDITVVIKPDPHVCEGRPDLMAAWRDIAKTEPGVYLAAASHAPLAPYVQVADAVVTDVSVAYLHSLAADKPAVVIDNPERFSETQEFDNDALAWQIRDAAEQVDGPEGLAAAVAKALDGPDALAARRAEVRESLFGNLIDGGAALRIIEKITELPISSAD